MGSNPTQDKKKIPFLVTVNILGIALVTVVSTVTILLLFTISRYLTNSQIRTINNMTYLICPNIFTSLYTHFIISKSLGSLAIAADFKAK
jgi:hypothetical protein